MRNSFCWMQLQSTDFEDAKKFYAALFGWKLTDTPEGDHPYTTVDAGEGPGAGMMPAEEGVPSHWLPYVQVEDLHHHIEKAQRLGAKIPCPITAIDSGGSFCIIQDPTGAYLGLYQEP